MADVKWIKLDIDMFSNPKVKRLRRLPDGNNLLLIWVMLLTMAGRCNAGGMIFITQNILYTAEDLADELGFTVDTVKLALKALSDLGMITLENGIEITGWSEHQSIDGLEKIREQTRKRVADYRERKQLQECNVTSNATVTHSSISISNSDSSSSSDSSSIYKESISNIISYLNTVVGTNYKANSKNTVRHISARLSEGYTEQDFYTVIDKMFSKWGADEKMSAYLRPETLFGSKFESYLNMKVQTKKSELEEWAALLKGGSDGE